MENYNSMEDQLSQMQHIDIIKQKFGTKTYIIGTIGGVALCTVYFTPLIANHSIDLVVLSLGLILLCWGLLKLLIGVTRKHDDFIYEPTGKKLKKHLLYFDNHNIQKVYDCFKHKDYAKIASIDKVMSSGHILKILSTDDGTVAVMQVFEYIPYDYIPSSEVAILKDNEAKFVSPMIKAS